MQNPDEFAYFANDKKELALLRQQTALCPVELRNFTTSTHYDSFSFESDLEVYITSCETALTDTIDGHLYVGLPQDGRCAMSSEEGVDQSSQLYNSLDLVYPKMAIRHYEWHRKGNGDEIELTLVEQMVNSGFALQGTGSWLK
jgi:hypothetical protein